VSAESLSNSLREKLERSIREAGEPVKILAHWVAAIRERDKVCIECGSSELLHAHHIKPKVLGGLTTLSNGVLLCSSCHMKRHHGEMSGYGLALQTGTLRRSMPKSKLSLTLDDDVIAGLDAYCATGRLERSTAINRLLAEGLRLIAEAGEWPKPKRGKPRAPRKPAA
jgi:hypothetical protein